MQETGGKPMTGKSGEKGRAQWLDATWRIMSDKYIGYTAPMTEINESYVLTSWIQDMFNRGYSEEKVALMHNAGGAKKCSRGINKHNVPYDSCAYVSAVVARLK